MPSFECCRHCAPSCRLKHQHQLWCVLCGQFNVEAEPYIEATDANPERAGNGCMIYSASRD
jgi:hypothetical protein